MHLIFAKDSILLPRENMRKFFETSFEFLNKDLNLQDHDEGINLSFMREKGAFGAGVDSNSRYPIQMIMNIDPPAAMLSHFCHEMIHVQDIVRGNLQRVKGNVLCYRNREYKVNREMMDDNQFLPHEIVTYNKMYSLANKVLKSFSPEMYNYAKMHLKNGVEPEEIYRKLNNRRKEEILEHGDNFLIPLDKLEGWKEI